MKELILRPHLGLGDAMICNGIVRELVKRGEKVIFPCKKSYYPSVSQLFEDCPEVNVLRLSFDGDEADRELDEMMEAMADERARILKLGYYNGGIFYKKEWDREFYRHAGMGYNIRWSRWKLPRHGDREVQPPLARYIFVHEDLARNAVISSNAMPFGQKLRPNSSRDNIFDYCALIEQADEVHCIDSCFAILADHITHAETRRVLHLEVKNTLPPSYSQKWEVVRPT